jgi:ADP-heptose:LPS heptosyltransferase
MLCAVPALRSIRLALPGARITLIGLPWAHLFAERFSMYVDDFVAFPGFPGLPESSATPEAFKSFVEDLRERELDLLVQMHGNGSITNTVVAMLGAKRICGFYPSDRPCPDAERFLCYPHDRHEIHRHLSLAEFLGAPAAGSELEFPVAEQDELEADTLVQRYGIGEFICIHAGAKANVRRWPVENFSTVADCLSAYGFHIVLTGSDEERGSNREVAGKMEYWPIDLTGLTTLGGLAALLRRCRLLVCNDTGVSHLAAALQVPSVVVFSNSEAPRWAPLNTRLHRACIPTGPHHVAVDAVIAEAKFHLRTRYDAA